MGSSQIQAGKAYVAIYGDTSPVQKTLKQLGPELRKQGEQLAAVGESTATAFARGNNQVIETAENTRAAAAAFNVAAASGAAFSQTAVSALRSTSQASERTAVATASIVEKMNQLRPATQGFATGLSALSSGNTGLNSGAMGVSAILQLLKAGGPAAKPLHDALSGIVGKAQQLEKIKPPAMIGGTSGKSAMNMAALGSAAATQSTVMPVSQLSKTLSQLTNGTLAASNGFEALWRIIVAGASDAVNAMDKPKNQLMAQAIVWGSIHGTIEGTVKSISAILRTATLGQFSPIFGQRTALQKVANQAQWSSLLGSRSQRQAAVEMGKQADAAAIGEAFTRGWVPGIAKYVSIAVPRGIAAGAKGLAYAPVGISRGLLGMLMGRTGSDSKAAPEIAAIDTGVQKMSLFRRTIDGVKAATGGMVNGLTNGLSHIALASFGAITALAAIHGTGTRGSSDRFEAIGLSAAKNKRDVGKTSELDFAARSSGTTLKTFDDQTDNFLSNIKKAREGDETAVKGFNNLGLSAEALSNMTFDKKLERLAAALMAVKDPIERDKRAIDLLGESGAELVPMLTNMQALRDRAKSAGAVINTADVESAKQMRIAMAALKTALTTAWQSIGAQSIRTTTQWVSGAAAFIQKNQQAVAWVLKIVGGVGAVAAGLALWVQFGGPIVAALGAVGAAVGAILSPVGMVVAAIAGSVAAWAYFSGSGKQALDYIGELTSNFYSFFQEIWSGVVAAVGKGDLALAGNIAWTALKVGALEVMKAIGVSFSDVMTTIYGLMATVADGLSNAYAAAATLIRGVQSNLTKYFVMSFSDIGVAWNEMCFDMGETMDSTHNSLAKTMGFAAENIRRMAAGEKLLTTDSPEAQEMAKTQDEVTEGIKIERQAARKKNREKLDPETRNRVEEIETKKNADAAAIEENRKAQIEAHAKKLSEQMASLPTDDARLDGMRNDLKNMIQQAKAIEAPKGKEPPKFVPDQQQLGGKLGDVAGTFNAAAAGGLGASSPVTQGVQMTAREVAGMKKIMERQEKAQQKWQMRHPKASFS